jgi:hypothetical protein
MLLREKEKDTRQLPAVPPPEKKPLAQVRNETKHDVGVTLQRVCKFPGYRIKHFMLSDPGEIDIYLPPPKDRAEEQKLINNLRKVLALYCFCLVERKPHTIHHPTFSEETLVFKNFSQQEKPPVSKEKKKRRSKAPLLTK